MKRAFAGVLGLLLGTVLVVSGCSDQPGPTESVPLARPAGTSYNIAASHASAAEVGVGVVKVLTREQPLAQDISVTETIGPEGGTINLKEAGLKVTFPEGAVDQAMDITVTAHAGALVAYTFGPHGTVFNAPVVLDQKLKGTNAHRAKSEFQGGYFLDKSDLQPATESAVVQETFPVEVQMDRLGNKVRMEVHHFSGYLVAIGRSGVRASVSLE